MKVTFVDFTEESTSKSVESTFQTLITEIDVRLHQYSCVDSSKWQEMAKNYWHKHENYHSDQLNEFILKAIQHWMDSSDEKVCS